MSSVALVAPFPYFGGKRRAASLVWQALGDPGGFVEPFAGSAAVLLARAPFEGRRTETINDADGWLVNTWRAIQLDPEEVAAHLATSLNSEIDYHARVAWLQARRDERLISWLEGDPEVCDPKAAAYWLTVSAAAIGNPFRPGPWHVVDGHLVKMPRGKGVNREIQHLGDGGKGVNRYIPHLGSGGTGVHREIQHLGNGGRGVRREEELADYMNRLSERLTHVRITCGDWRRVLTPAASRHSAGDAADRFVGVFLDPPYSVGDQGLYSVAKEEIPISHQCREWAAAADDTRYRIVLSGYDDEHDELLQLGWRKIHGKAGGKGYSKTPDNHKRERLWLSPNCAEFETELLSYGE